MIEIDKTLDAKSLFEYRENTLKAKKMGRLEAHIDKFLTERGVKFHRQFPIRIGCKHPKRYAVSFWLQDKGIILDMVGIDDDMNLYEPGRHVDVLYHPWAKIKAIVPIDKKLMWVNIKKELVMLIQS